MTEPLDIDALMVSSPHDPIDDENFEALVAEVRRLREMVLACHERGPNGWCRRCSHNWPCPSARAAGAR